MPALRKAEVLPPEDAGTDIALIVEHTPQIVLLEPERYDAFYAYVKAETGKLVPDTSTAKGRDAIRKTANDITKSKAAIEKARLGLTAAWRDQTAQVNEAGKKIKADLEALHTEVRKPLTDWEAAEEARVKACDKALALMKSDAIVTIEDTAATIRARGKVIFDMVLDAAQWGDKLPEAQAAKDHAVQVLKTALARLIKEEADRAQADADRKELEALRAKAAAEKEAQEAKERAEQEAREAAERKREYARSVIDHIHQCGLGMIGGQTYPYVILIHELEKKVIVTEDDFGDMACDVEKARVETLARVVEASQAAAERAERRAREEAAEEARREEARKAEEALQAREARHQSQLAAERKRAADAEAEAQAERDRIAREAASEKAKADAEAAAKAKREADQAHRTKVKTEAKLAIMSCGADEETARKIVNLIIAGEVPAVRLEF